MWGVKMTSFRRLVMGVVEAMAVLSIFFGTFAGGIYGAALGALFRSSIFGIASNVDIHLQGIGQIATTGTVFGLSWALFSDLSFRQQWRAPSSFLPKLNGTPVVYWKENASKSQHNIGRPRVSKRSNRLRCLLPWSALTARTRPLEKAADAPHDDRPHWCSRCLSLALFGHGAMSALSPLCGQERT
jgi:hypothetical protein